MSIETVRQDASAPQSVIRKPPGGATHLGFIDALRGWAFLGVLLCHAGQHVAGPYLLLKLADQGQFGVQLFYIVSAATLFLSLNVRWRQDQRPYTAFFIRRFFRIAPMFWVAIAFYVWWDGMGPRFWAPNGITAADIAVTAAFAHGWHPLQINAVVPGGWSVGIEMSFYLLMPLLFTWITSLRRALWFALMAIVAGEGMSHVFHRLIAAHWPAEQLYVVNKFTSCWLPSQLPVFALGGVLFFLLRRETETSAPAAERSRLNPESPTGKAWLLFAMVAILGGACVSWVNPVLKQHVVYSIVFVLFAWALSLNPLGFFVNRATKYIGMISFSAYLSHFFALDACEKLLDHAFGRHFGSGGGLDFTLLLAMSLPLTVVISSFTYRFIEKPGQRLGKKLIAMTDRQLPIQFKTTLPVSGTGS